MKWVWTGSHWIWVTVGMFMLVFILIGMVSTPTTMIAETTTSRGTVHHVVHQGSLLGLPILVLVWGLIGIVIGAVVAVIIAAVRWLTINAHTH